MSERAVGQQQGDLTSAKRPAPRLTGLEADLTYLYRRGGAIMRELSAYAATLAQHGTGVLTEPVLQILSAALLPQSAVPARWDTWKQWRGDAWSTLTGGETCNA